MDLGHRDGATTMRRIGVRARSGGQSSVEYLVGCIVVLALLAADSTSGESVVSLVIQSIRLAYARFAAAISIP